MPDVRDSDERDMLPSPHDPPHARTHPAWPVPIYGEENRLFQVWDYTPFRRTPLSAPGAAQTPRGLLPTPTTGQTPDLQLVVGTCLYIQTR